MKLLLVSSAAQRQAKRHSKCLLNNGIATSIPKAQRGTRQQVAQGKRAHADKHKLS